MLPVAAPPRQRGVIAAEDACGVSPEQVTIGSSGEGVANVDFLLNLGRISTTSSRHSMCHWALLRSVALGHVSPYRGRHVTHCVFGHRRDC